MEFRARIEADKVSQQNFIEKIKYLNFSEIAKKVDENLTEFFGEKIELFESKNSYQLLEIFHPFQGDKKAAVLSAMSCARLEKYNKRLPTFEMFIADFQREINSIEYSRAKLEQDVRAAYLGVDHV